jgi:hypothetical protein
MMEWILKCVSIELVDCSLVWLAQKLYPLSVVDAISLLTDWKCQQPKWGDSIYYYILYEIVILTFFSIGTHHAGGRRQFRLSLVTFLAVIPYALWTWCCCWWNSPNNCVVPSSSALYYVCVKTYLISLKNYTNNPYKHSTGHSSMKYYYTTCFVHLLSSSFVM